MNGTMRADFALDLLFQFIPARLAERGACPVTESRKFLCASSSTDSRITLTVAQRTDSFQPSP
jgi:hypothetical protein